MHRLSRKGGTELHTEARRRSAIDRLHIHNGLHSPALLFLFLYTVRNYGSSAPWNPGNPRRRLDLLTMPLPVVHCPESI